MQVEAQLGKKRLESFDDLSSNPDTFMAELRQLYSDHPELFKPQRDPLNDTDYFGQQFDPTTWPFPTFLHEVKVGEKQYPLPDGTCPALPPGPDGVQRIPPDPDPDGYCPVLKANTPIAEGNTVIVVDPGDGSVPVVVGVSDPGTAPSPSATPSPMPSTQSSPPPPPKGQPDLAKAAAILGISEQELKTALGPPPPDLAAAAQKLGITQQELKAALDASFS